MLIIIFICGCVCSFGAGFAFKKSLQIKPLKESYKQGFMDGYEYGFMDYRNTMRERMKMIEEREDEKE